MRCPLEEGVKNCPTDIVVMSVLNLKRYAVILNLGVGTYQLREFDDEDEARAFEKQFKSDWYRHFIENAESVSKTIKRIDKAFEQLDKQLHDAEVEDILKEMPDSEEDMKKDGE